jgi:flagellar hook assembly protein FlgD
MELAEGNTLPGNPYEWPKDCDFEWDGKNDGGQKVASGAYIARVTIGGNNERFLKLAVIK